MNHHGCDTSTTLPPEAGIEADTIHKGFPAHLFDDVDAEC